jgi:hypothetical protein
VFVCVCVCACVCVCVCLCVAGDRRDIVFHIEYRTSVNSNYVTSQPSQFKHLSYTHHHRHTMVTNRCSTFEFDDRCSILASLAWLCRTVALLLICGTLFIEATRPAGYLVRTRLDNRTRNREGRDQPDGRASPCASGPTRAMFACELTGHDQKQPPSSPLVPG